MGFWREASRVGGPRDNPIPFSFASSAKLSHEHDPDSFLQTGLVGYKLSSLDMAAASKFTAYSRRIDDAWRANIEALSDWMVQRDYPLSFVYMLQTGMDGTIRRAVHEVVTLLERRRQGLSAHVLNLGDWLRGPNLTGAAGGTEQRLREAFLRQNEEPMRLYSEMAKMQNAQAQGVFRPNPFLGQPQSSARPGPVLGDWR